MIQKIKKKMQLTDIEKKWILYDVGNSAFVLLVATVFPIYFDVLTGMDGMSKESSLVIWGYAISITTIIVALIGPILGIIADVTRRKKQLLMFFTCIGVVGTICLGVIDHWVSFIIIFVFARTGWSMSLIFYDSMLIDISTPKKMDRVSSHGYAWGYVGSCIPFIIGLSLILMYEKIGISFNTAVTTTFTLNAVWWWATALPLFKSYEQVYYNDSIEGVTKILSNLKSTLKEIYNDKKIFLFLIAYFFYIDGVFTTIDMATAYGTAIGLDSNSLLLALFVTQLVSFPSALIFGRLSQTYDSERLISVCILAYFFIGIFTIFMYTPSQFWTNAILVGMFQGGIQSLSRSYFGKIIPIKKAAEYYGIFDIFGKGAAFTGTILVSTITQLTGNLHLGVSAIAPLIFIGFIFFRIAIRYNR